MLAFFVNVFEEEKKPEFVLRDWAAQCAYVFWREKAAWDRVKVVDGRSVR